MSCFLAAGSFVAALVMLLGSWAPFTFDFSHPISAFDAYFAAAGEQQRSGPDAVANTALGLPFAFLCTGFLYSLGKPLLWKAGATVMMFAITAALSLVCELPQAWLPGRVPSILDTAAQLAGAVVGCVAWWLVGPSCGRAIDGLLNASRTTLRAQAAVTLAALAALMWSILPGRILVSPADYARKWSHGQIELIPFSLPIGHLGDAVLQWGWSLGVGILMGLWALQFIQICGRQNLSPAGQWLLVLGFGLLPELVQIPVLGRFASATDAVFSIAGAGLGFAIGQWVWREPSCSAAHRARRIFQQSGFWFWLAIGYLLLWCLLSWWPLEFVTDLGEIKSQLSLFVADPFVDHRGSSLALLFSTLRSTAMAAGLGLVAGVGVGLIGRAPRHRLHFILGFVLLLLMAVVVAGGIEVGQLLERSRTAGALGMISRTLGMWLGLAVGAIVVRGA